MLRPPQSLLAALLATTVVITAALGWAGWRLLNQQRAIDEQRAREQVEGAADASAADIRGKLAEAGDRLSEWLSNPRAAPPFVGGAVVVAIGPDAVQVMPPDGLPFVPVADEASARATFFAAVEPEEFGGNPLAAAKHYRALSRHRDPEVRAGALLRLGRVLRKAHDFQDALAVYEQLGALGGVRTDDLAAELAGLDGQRAALIALGDRQRAQRVAEQLAQGLDRGQWRISRGMAEFYRDAIGASARPDSWRLAGALSDVWRDANGQLPIRGQRVFAETTPTVLVMWRSSGTYSTALAAFVDKFLPLASAGPLAWQLVDPEGRAIAGGTAAPSQSVTRIIGNAEYPWTLHLWAASPALGTASNRATLAAMMSAMLIFVWGAAYFMARAMRREAAVARLQTDFVAAVSHEFRSPLTSLRQMAEMLQSDRVPSEERRRTYYRLLAGEAGRLQRLVETLLNFGKMEAGADRYQFVDLDAAALVRNVVDEIEPQARDAGKAIQMDALGADVHVLADHSALSVALRNLIDNAVKYSPGQPAVWVRCAQENGHAAISVEDRGVGIPRAEQQAIFRKFVRGRAAIDANIKGTGVGLSMVEQIVAAHGGEIRVDSEPGRGSTFTIVLPTAQT